METRKMTVVEVLSPGSIRADDGQTYVVHGVPDSGEDLPTYAVTVSHVRSRLLNSAVYVDDESAEELPDLPGVCADLYDSEGKSIVPRLAAEVAGLLAGYPLK